MRLDCLAHRRYGEQALGELIYQALRRRYGRGERLRLRQAQSSRQQIGALILAKIQIS
jgi:hypothetical protein